MANPKVTLRTRELKKGYSYQIDYTIDGKRYRRSVGTRKREAEEIRDKIQTDITYGNFDIITSKPRVVSLNDLIKEFFEYKKNIISVKTQNRYKNHFIPFQDFINSYFTNAAENISLIQGHHIRECIDNILEGKSEQQWNPVTINRMIQLLSSLFIYSIKKSYRKDNPTVDIEKLSVAKSDAPDYYSYEELELIWENVDDFYLPIYQLLYYTGLRVGELINLTWDKVSLNNKSPIIRIVSTSEWRTKSGNFRSVPLHKKALVLVKNQIDKNEKYVFTSKSNMKLHPNTILEVLKKTLKELKIYGDVHKFRHTFASHLVMGGQNIYDIKELLGHSKLESTMIYSHLSPEHKQKVVNSLK